MKRIFSKFKGFIIDLDGVMYLDQKLLPFAKSFINFLNKNNKKYIFLTNDSSVSPHDYSMILRKLGIICSKEQVVTPISNFINIIKNIKKKENKRNILILSQSSFIMLRTFLRKSVMHAT